MLQPGTILSGRYRIFSLVGRGGMGSVYCAHDERLGREVAIKLLRPDLAADSKACEAFLREAQIAAQIIHPNVVRTYDAGDDPAGTYLVQEFLTGSTLDHVLPLPPRRAAEVLAQIAAALETIHACAYVHCDVKPQNILLKDNGAPVLLDFGIARAEGTATTTLIATPHYLAPERAQGSLPTAASDLYALGIVLYQTIAGHPPFDAPEVHAIIQQHLTAPMPRLGGQDPAVLALDRIIARLTAKRPQDRYADAGAVSADLEAIARGDAHLFPTLAVAVPTTAAVLPAVVPSGSSVSQPGPRLLVQRVERLADAWTTAPPWRQRRWLAVAAVPLLLLLGIGLARGSRSPGVLAPATAGPVQQDVAAPPVSSPASTVSPDVVVPHVVGLQFEAARQVLATQGLVAERGAERPDQLAAGIVVEASPPPETPLPRGSSVSLTVSAGPVDIGGTSDDEQNDRPPPPQPGRGKGKGKGKKD